MKKEITRLICAAICCTPIIGFAQTGDKFTSTDNLYKEGKEDYSQTDIILEKPVSDHRPIIQKSKLKKQLSPLRYPGGKSKMLDHLLPYLKGKKYFVEAFCGGARF